MSNELKCQCVHCDLRDLFFSHVTPDLLEKICESRMEKVIRKGDSIVSAGDPVLEFMYLKEGLVKLFRTTEDGKSQIIAIGRPLDFVSLISVFADETYRYSVSAIEDSVACILSIDFVRKMVVENGSFALDLIRKMSRTSEDIISNSLDIRKKQLKGRIAHMLLFFAKDIYKKNVFILPISRKEMAEYIGMSTENVIRTLSEFRKDGILHIYGKHIEIVDVDLLQRVSDHG